MTDQDIFVENGIKMTMDLFEIADQKITEVEAALIWDGLTPNEKMTVHSHYTRIIKKSSHV
jgi:hypothetical protein